MVCLYIGKATVKESGREEGTNGTTVYKSPNRKWVNGRMLTLTARGRVPRLVKFG